MYNVIIKQLIDKAENASTENPTDYTGEDGLLYCGICHEPKQQRIEVGKQFFPNGLAPSPCKCDQERMRAAQAERERTKARELSEELRRSGLTDRAYYGNTFDKDNGNTPHARQAAEWYVENFADLKKAGKGMIFMGKTGTGKTFYACCIANALMDKGIPVWVTTVQPLLRAAGDFNKADKVFNRIKEVTLLVLDDFGTTQNNARNLELLFEIIDTRYRSGLPLIITTNLSPTDMKNAPLELDRIYDRVKEMCMCEKSPVFLDGRSVREQKAREARGNRR
ncbi:MAG: ATP-binding protein [Oscillospiraceae bacterium]